MSSELSPYCLTSDLLVENCSEAPAPEKPVEELVEELGEELGVDPAEVHGVVLDLD